MESNLLTFSTDPLSAPVACIRGRASLQRGTLFSSNTVLEGKTTDHEDSYRGGTVGEPFRKSVEATEREKIGQLEKTFRFDSQFRVFCY